MKITEKELNFLIHNKKTRLNLIFWIVICFLMHTYSDNESFIENNYKCVCHHDIIGEYKGAMNCTEGLNYYCEKFKGDIRFYDKLCDKQNLL